MSAADAAAAVERLVRPAIRQLSAYHVPPAAGLVKLDAMENPYALPESLRAGWLECLAAAEINRYPDPGGATLTALIRQVFDVPAESDILLGNGSDELIQMLALLVGGPGRTFLAPSPSFSMYEMISLFTGTGFRAVPLDSSFGLDAGAMLKAIGETAPACVFLAYPNNPTGNCFDPEAIREIIARAPGLVVVDEAYCLFSGQTFLTELPAYPNLLVMRTLSKSGLAGLRLGMLMGDPRWTRELDKVRLPYNINCLTQAGAAYCLEHYAVLEAQGRSIREERGYLLEALGAVPGVTAYPSDANFILFRLDRDAVTVFERMRADGVLIKNLHQPGGALENCLRVTVSTPEENSTFLAALNRALAAD